MTQRNRNLSSHIKIRSMGCNDEGEQFLKLVVSAGGDPRVELLSLRDLEASPQEALARLNARLVTLQARNEFLDRVQQRIDLQPSFRVISRPGWDRFAFVFPDGTFLPRGANLRIALPPEWKAYGAKFRASGDLNTWRRIPELARGNSRLMLAIALAFVGPVVDLLKLEIVMIQLFGPPGAGKTAIAIAAGSVWGGDDDGLFAESWNHTANDLERVAAAHQASFLILDETRTAERSKLPPLEVMCSVIMRLADGKMKGRLPDVPCRFRARPAVLSTTNYSLDDMSRQMRASVRVPIDDALRGRMIDVPLADGVLGAFESLHGYADHQAMTAALVEIARENSGVASEAYIQGIIEWLTRDRLGLIAWIKQRRETYRAVARRRVTSASRDLTRFHEKFANIFAAAELARELRVVPWTPKEIGEAIMACERAHVEYLLAIATSDSVAKLRAPALNNPLERFRRHVRATRSGFTDLRLGLLDPGGDHSHRSCDGYVNRRADGSLEYLFSEPKLVEISGGKAAALDLKASLSRSGWLFPDGNRLSTRRTIWSRGSNRREHVIAVRVEAFENGE